MPPAGKSSRGGGVIFAEQQVRATSTSACCGSRHAVTYQVLRGAKRTCSACARRKACGSSP
jgi:hypothetical protein